MPLLRWVTTGSRSGLQGQVSPESWTHGSAEQRQKWLLQGFSTGDPNKCNTFASGAL